MKKCLLLFFIIQNIVNGQSYLKELNVDDAPFLRYEQNSKLELGHARELSIMTPTWKGFDLFNISQSGIPESGYRILIDSLTGIFPDFRYDREKNFHLISYIPLTPFSATKQGGVCLINFKNNTNWCRKTTKTGYTSATNCFVSASDYVITDMILSTETNPNDKLVLSKLKAQNGESLWNYSFEKENSASNLNHAISDIAEFSTGEILVGFSIDGKDGLLKISPDGELIKDIVLATDSVRFGFSEFSIDSFNNFYVPGVIGSTDPLNLDRQGFIAKFNSDLQLIWAKKLSAEKFPYKGLSLNSFPNGEVLFSYFTYGDLPVISGKLDLNGNLVQHTGYSFFSPEIEIGLDSSIFFFSKKKYYEDGTSENSTIISKTDIDGLIKNCPQFDACLTISNFNIPFTNWDWLRDTVSPLAFHKLSIDSLIYTTTDHCGTPRPPVPFFHLPDTICQNQTLRPDSLYNHLAHATEWTITSQNTNLEFADASWNHQFTEPGTYQIEQEIWLLGCSEFFTRTLVVLPDSLGNLLGDNRLICEDDPLLLSPTAARPLRTFEWSEGSQNPSITISNSGTYAVTASDGFCSASDEVELTFFKDKYPNGIFELPTDSAVCVDLLPLSLMPASEFTDSFYLADSTIPQSVFELKTEGNYQISAQIENCRVEKNFELKITPCEIDIFFPNTFSPNDDGINDFVQPFGKEFDGLSLEIFNRWGGKVFETTENPFAWDGNFDGKKANEGVYVFVFKYRNQRNGLEEMVSGDVLLLR